MEIYQYISEGRVVVAAGVDGRRYIVPGVGSTLALLKRASSGQAVVDGVTSAWKKYGRKLLPRRARGPILPVHPPEVWGCGVTYRKSADDRACDAPVAGDIYARAHAGPRPETFFKATAARCVGPGEPIGIRQDSKLTAAEPELAYVVGRDGVVVAYTLANDVSAWDIERDNPLYLPQSKIFTACCALGPCLVTADALDPLNLEIKMTITRRGTTVFAGAASTSQLKFSIPYLHTYVTRHNPLPAGTVVMTGTGVMMPAGMGLEEGDAVAIAAAPFGELVNHATTLPETPAS